MPDDYPLQYLIFLNLLVLGGTLLGLYMWARAIFSRRAREALWPVGARPEPPNLLGAAAGLVVFALAWPLAGTALVLLEVDPGAWKLPVQSLLGQLSMLLAAFAGLLAGSVRDGEGPASLGLDRPRARYILSALNGWCCVLPLLFASMYASSLVYQYVFSAPPEPQKIILDFAELPAGPKLVMMALAVLAAPLAEEIFFRGLIFASLRARLGFWPAALASALIFGAVHMSLAQFASLALLGFAMAWLYNRTGSLWPSIAMHAVHNGVTLLMIIDFQ